ncbi:MAG TPA: hypothetical protein PLF78_15635 [Caulobacter sp.]|nr:hypothetical protein [Caulobacter sp.]
MQFVKVPLAAAVAALTLTGCNLPCQCPTTPAASSTTAKTVQASTGGSSSATRTTATRTRTVHRPAGRRERVEGGYRYAAGSRRYASGVSVEVSETETSSSRYRYSETETRYGARGGGYAYGSGASGGYAYGATSAGQYGAPPPPPPVAPSYRRDYHLAGTDRHGYLTWPGKVED